MTGIMYEERLDVTFVAGLNIEVAPGAARDVRVRVSGEIDLSNASALRRTLLIALAAHRGDLFLDLQRVSFCDCSALNALLAVRRTALQAGRRLHITAAGRPVERLLQLTGTRTLFA
ncbi:STAS domain-containing protein [Streptomyces sp. NPDC006450]|uniref:STAS domain-containing protein n=1 Tax=Streptomyces sp. NPDC006450 TaxID=3155458 RepID=UPI0033BBC107